MRTKATNLRHKATVHTPQYVKSTAALRTLWPGSALCDHKGTARTTAVPLAADGRGPPAALWLSRCAAQASFAASSRWKSCLRPPLSGRALDDQAVGLQYLCRTGVACDLERKAVDSSQGHEDRHKDALRLRDMQRQAW